MEITNEIKPVLMRNFDKVNLECKGLEKVIDITSKEIVENIENLDLIESGAFSEKVSEKWIHFNEGKDNSKETILFAGFNNNDTTYITMCLLEKDPVSVFEGMAIASKATNISKGVLYIPEGRGDLKEELNNKLKKVNLLGFEIEIVIGKINIREADKNVLIHHIETLALISAYFNLGDSFRQTKIISVSGNVKKCNIGEVGSKSSVKSIIEEISKGVSSDVKAILLGGITGRCISESAAENTYFNGYGNSEIIVLSNKDCIVDIAKKCAKQVNENTCGKCTFCREGSHQLRQILSDASEGKGKAEDIELIQELSKEISEETLCSLGQRGMEFVETSLELFKNEYEAHIKRKKCPTGTCQAFLNIGIIGDKCDSCGECMDVCQYDAIEGKKGFIHMIDEFECTKCGKCIEVCPVNAIVKIPTNKSVGPEKLTKVGRWKKRG